jgi:hypothetical protein
MRVTGTRLAGIVGVGLLVAVAVLGAAGNARSTNGCVTVVGHLNVSNIEPAENRMTGKIHGRYTYTFEGAVPSTNNPQVLYLEGRSFVQTRKGDIRFIENSAAANGSELSTNNATLMTVEGGTGMWKDATGHIALYGFFHLSTQTGKFDYRGEVCLAG